MKERTILPALAALLVAVGAPAAASAAQTLTVSTTDDPVSATHCPSVDGIFGPEPCSLRAALAQNADDHGGDTIVLPPGTYSLLRPLPSVEDAVTITGQGAAPATVIDAAGQPGAFVFAPAVGKVPVTLSHLTVRGTSGGPAIDSEGAEPLTLGDDVVRDNLGAADQPGGGLVVNGGAAAILGSVFSGNAAAGTGKGGGIAVLGGDLTIRDSELRANTTTRNGGGGALLAGGAGTISIQRSRLTGNAAAYGAALATMLGARATISVTDSTFDDNRDNDSTGAAVLIPGGDAGSHVLLAGDTFVDNDGGAPGSSATFSNNEAAAQLRLQNSVVVNAGTRACDAPGILVSLGHNVTDDASCALSGPGDRQGVDPLLGPLAANGGPTFTALPLAGSPLIDAADASACSATDQRGIVRPQGAGCDIGAVEAVPFVAPPGPTGPAPQQGIRVSGLRVAPHVVRKKAVVGWTAAHTVKVRFTVKQLRHRRLVVVGHFTYNSKAGRNRRAFPTSVLRHLHTGGYRLEAVVLARPALAPARTTFRYAPPRR